ncbi:MAG: polysialyltransferase family glycosyltransferase [Candidatus Micrarchaeota archaeon]
MSARSVYIIATPYHFLLCAGVASYVDKNPDKRLVIASHFKDTEKWVSALRGWKRNPFSDILVVGERRSGVAAEKVATMRANLASIGSTLKSPPGPFDAFVFNIEQPEGQLVAYECSKRKGACTYVEDGIGAYTRRDIRDPLHLLIVKKLLYGLWFERVSTQIEYQYFDKALVLRPDLVPKKPDNVELSAIPADIFERLDKDGLVNLIFKEYGEKPAQDCEAIVFLPFHIAAEQMGYERTVAAYSRIIDALIRKGIRTLVKYHPREDKGDFLSISGMKGIKTVHQAITSELLFLRWKKSGKRIVIGDTTTALSSCKLMVPDAKSISIIDILGYDDKVGLGGLFSKWDVLRPKTMEELLSLLD